MIEPTSQGQLADDELSPPAVLAELMARHQHSLLGFLIGRLRDRDTAQDCLQDTFVRAYEALLQGRSITGAWLFQVARHRAIDHFRQRQRLDENRPSLVDITTPDGCADWDYAGVREAVNRLSPHDRELLYLAHVDGLSSTAIGANLNVRPGAVRMRLFRAHKRFRSVY